MINDYKTVIKRESKLWMRRPMYWAGMSIYWIGTTAILLKIWITYECVGPVETLLLFIAIVVSAMGLAHSQQAGINHLAEKVAELEERNS